MQQATLEDVLQRLAAALDDPEGALDRQLKPCTPLLLQESGEAVSRPNATC